MPRLLRDSPLNGIWEGSGNVMSLDVLRAMAREPEGLPAFLAECELARGADARLDAHLDALPATLAELAGEDAQWLARRAVEDLALAFQASLLVRNAPPAVADAFCAGRLGEARGRAYGTLPAASTARAIVERALTAQTSGRVASSARSGSAPSRPAERLGRVAEALDVVGVLLDVGADLVRAGRRGRPWRARTARRSRRRARRPRS